MSAQNIVNITEANLHQTLQQSATTPVLFYFWSARSQHCEQLTPVLESLAAQYNGLFTLAKVDCDAEQMLASQFGLRAIPTVYLFQNGQPVDGFQGPQPEEVIRALLEKVLPSEEELKARQAIEFIAGAGDKQPPAEVAFDDGPCCLGHGIDPPQHTAGDEQTAGQTKHHHQRHRPSPGRYDDVVDLLAIFEFASNQHAEATRQLKHPDQR